MTQRYRLDSDSRSSAKVLDPVVLWTSGDSTRRLAFLPHVHDNPNDPQACVSGQLRYQRKGSDGQFVDEDGLRLSELHNGEWTKYELSSEAALALFRTLGDLYKLYAEQGPPRGTTTVIAVDGDLSAEVDALGGTQVVPHLAALLRRLAKESKPGELVDQIAGLGVESIADLRNAAGIANLQAALREWPTLPSAEESAWQDFFKRNEWILAQAFAQPVILFRSGASVRPETLARTEQQIVDYVYANSLTRNLALVEIKTPAARLLAANPYRDSGIYRPSGELVGGVSQILAYRHSVKQYAGTLLRGAARAALRTDPLCVVVVGSLDQLDDDAKVGSFEQFRRELRNVQVLTFDEVQARARGMLDLLTRGTVSSQGEGDQSPPDTDDNWS